MDGSRVIGAHAEAGAGARAGPRRTPGAAGRGTPEAVATPLRVAYVTNAVPHYREGFFQRLFDRDGLDVHVFCQVSIPGMNLEMRHDALGDRVTLVRFIGLDRDRFGWQRLPWARLLSSFDVIFVPGNPRIVSNVVLAALARMRRRPVVICGHAHTAGSNPFTERLRLWWWRRFDHVLVYTDGDVRRLAARGFAGKHVLGMNNGLDQRRIDEAAAAWPDVRLASWRERQAVAGRRLVLSSARLSAKNRFDLWLDAMPAVRSQFPDLLWCAIGDGPERGALEARARRLGLADHVRLLGGIHEERDLAPWFLSSRLLVHPAAVGLTLLHAFGYGLPVVTQDDPDSQMPEFDAFVPGETGLLYRRGESESLARAVASALADESSGRRMGEAALRIARERYNVDVMADRFTQMARLAARERSNAPRSGPRGPA